MSGDNYTNSYAQLRDWYKGLLPIYAYYYFSRKAYISYNWFSNWAIFFCLTVLAMWYVNLKDQMLMAAISGSSREEFTNNIGYDFAYLFPLVVFLRKNIYKIAFVLFIILFVILAMKRGAYVVTFLGILVYYFYYFKSMNAKNKIGVLLSFILVLVSLYYLSDYMIHNSDYFNARIQETMEGQTNREYGKMLISYQNVYSDIEFLFGKGINGSLLVMQIRAHNDWIEFLLDFGIVGVIVFSLLWVTLYSSYMKLKKNKEIGLAILLVLIITFTKTFFSMAIGSLTIFSSSILAFCLSFNKGKINNL